MKKNKEKEEREREKRRKAGKQQKKACCGKDFEISNNPPIDVSSNQMKTSDSERVLLATCNLF